MDTMVTKRINIEIKRHRETGMYLAYSDDMKGLYVHARTLEELNARIPVAIKDIYEASGHPVAFVEPIQDDEPADFGFEPTRRSYLARDLEAA
jgi:hypothetical protein